MNTMARFIKAAKPIMDAWARGAPCDHVRQYFHAGMAMPCANPYCSDGIGGNKMAAQRTLNVDRPRGIVTVGAVLYRRDRDEHGNWSWQEE